MAGDIQAAPPWYRWADKTTFLASQAYTDLSVTVQSVNIDLTTDKGDYDVARGTTTYFHIATVSANFAADIDATASLSVQTQSLAESCVITGNPLRSGKAEIVGYV